MRLALPPAGSSVKQRRHREAAPRLLPVRWKKGRMSMHLYQMRYHHGERISRLRVAKRWNSVTILVVGLAGLIHLSLIREHFAEQFVYGLVFTALAMFQLTLAFLLAVRPGAAVYRVGIWGSGLIVLVYVATRLLPLPGASAPEEVDALGIAVTGVVQWTNAVYAAPLTWVGTNSWSALTPLLVGSPLPHVWLAAPWWSLPAALVLAVLVGLNLWLSTRMLVEGYVTARGRRARLLALLPAG